MKLVDEGEKTLMERTTYRQLVGCIFHLANTTRPDFAFAAGFLSRFMSEPGCAHWKAAKHVLRYLEGTRKLGIVHGKMKSSESNSLHGNLLPYCGFGTHALSKKKVDVDQRWCITRSPD